MVKTTVYLDDETVAALKGISKRSAKPQAQLIRDALRAFTRTDTAPARWYGHVRRPAIRLPAQLLKKAATSDDGDRSRFRGLWSLRSLMLPTLLRAAMKGATLLFPPHSGRDLPVAVRLGNPALLRFLADIQEGAFAVRECRFRARPSSKSTALSIWDYRTPRRLPWPSVSVRIES
jgi:hypothetical protein